VVLDLTLCERFGWTLAELYEQDEAVLLPALAAINIREAVKHCYVDFLGSQGKYKPSDNDWKLYALAQKATK